MTIRCAWCGNHLGEKDGRGTSHGICLRCLDFYFPEGEQPSESRSGEPALVATPMHRASGSLSGQVSR